MPQKPQAHLKTLEDGNAKFIVDFFSIDEALAADFDPESPVFIDGRALHEDLSSFLSRKPYDILSSEWIDNAKYNYQRHFRPIYRGNFKLLDKINSFMNSPTLYSSGVSDEFIEDISGIPTNEIQEIIRDRYVGTRKIKDGAEDDISDYIEFYFQAPNPDLAIISTNGYITSHDALIVANWHARGRPYKLICLNQNQSISNSAHVIEKYGVDIDEACIKIAEYLNITIQSVTNHASYWSATSYFSEGADKRFLTASQCQHLFDFVRKVGHDDNKDDLIINVIPPQKPAPLMFSSSELGIELQHTTPKGITFAQARGSARALSNQAQDLTAISGLENAAPRANAKIARITSILDRIARSTSIDESDIIEFGVEFSGFETKIHDAQSRIGELSLGDVLAFLIEGRHLLSRFEIWSDYESAAKTANKSQDIKSIAENAIDILNSESARGILSEQAKIRVIENTSEDKTQNIEDNFAEGVARSAENLTSAVGKSIFSTYKGVEKSTIKSVSDEISQRLSSNIGKFIIENSEKLIVLSQTRGAKWIEMLVHLIRSQ